MSEYRGVGLHLDIHDSITKHNYTTKQDTQKNTDMQDFINKTNPNYLPVNMKVHDLLNMYLSKVADCFVISPTLKY
jgi:hypothetical protein